EIAQRLVNHSSDHFLSLLQTDRNRPEGKVLQVVRRPVERIDDPGSGGGQAVGAHPALLAEDGIFGKEVLQEGGDGLFALPIGARHPVVAGLDMGVCLSELFPMLQENRCADSRRFDGCFDFPHGAHSSGRLPKFRVGREPHGSTPLKWRCAGSPTARAPPSRLMFAPSGGTALSSPRCVIRRCRGSMESRANSTSTEFHWPRRVSSVAAIAFRSWGSLPRTRRSCSSPD